MTFRNLLLTAAVATAGMSFSSPVQAGADPFLGEIMEVGFNFCPRGWASADGQILPISQYNALFSLYGTNYGGDGRTSFALPDLRGRASIHAGQGAGLAPYSMGQKSGSESVTVGIENMPSHTHRAGIRTVVATGNTPDPNRNSFARQESYPAYSTDTPNEVGNQPRFMNPKTVWVEPTGSGQAINHRSPYLTTRKCISLSGIFPPRN